MNFTVCYYGLLAERRGLTEEQVASSALTPAALYAELDALHHLGLSVANFRVAVNDQFCPWDHLLDDDDHVALLPPMSGG